MLRDSFAVVARSSLRSPRSAARSGEPAGRIFQLVERWPLHSRLWSFVISRSTALSQKSTASPHRITLARRSAKSWETLPKWSSLELRRRDSTGEPVSTSRALACSPTRTGTGHWVGSSYPIKDATGAVTRIGVVWSKSPPKKDCTNRSRTLAERFRKEMEPAADAAGREHHPGVELEPPAGFSSDLGPDSPGSAAGICRLRVARRHHRAAGSPGRGLPLGQRACFHLCPSARTTVPGAAHCRTVPLMIFSKSQMQGFDAEITKSFLAEGIRSLCCVPLVRPKGPLGVLVLGSTRKNAFQPEDLDLLKPSGRPVRRGAGKPSRAVEIEALKNRLAEEKKLPGRRDSFAGSVRRNRWRQSGAQEGARPGGDRCPQ